MSLFADGVFTCDSVRSRASFHELPAPTDAEVARVTRQIATRVLRLLRKEGLVPDPDAPADTGADDDLSALDACQAAAVQGRITPRLPDRRLQHRDRLPDRLALALCLRPSLDRQLNRWVPLAEPAWVPLGPIG